MRLISFSVLAIVAASSSALAAAPVFEFKGYVAGVEAADDKLAGCTKEAEFLSCTNFDDQIAGQKAIVDVQIYGKRLSSVLALIDRGSYGEVLAAVTQKYGRPCRVAQEQWANALGTKLDNTKSVWCFATGELTIREIGSNLDKMGFAYYDTNQPPTKAPKVDF